MGTPIPLPIMPGDLTAIGPLLAVVIAAAGFLAVDMAFTREELKNRWTFIIGIIGAALAAVTALMLDIGTGESRLILGEALYADLYTVFFDLLFALLMGASLVLSWTAVERARMKPVEFYSLAAFSFAGMFLTSRAADLLSLFLAIELLSMPLYVLAGFATTSKTGREAALKYFVLGSVASAILLFGIALMYGGTGSIDYVELGAQVSSGGRDSPLVLAGLALILAGLAFKVGAVPFHMWTPDVYEGSPTAVTALMATGVKAAGLAAAIRFLAGPMAAALSYVSVMLWWIVALSMVVGNAGAMLQSNVKRLLAYSSIAHAGYILMGLLGDSLGTAAAVYYTAVYVLSVAGAFGVVQYFGDGDRELETVDDFNGAAKRHPWISLLFTIFLLSLAGIPPTGGFVAKFFVFGSAIQTGHIGLALLGVLTSVIGIYYYLRLVIAMWMKDEGRPVLAELSPTSWVVLGLLAASVLALGCMPGWLWLIVQSAVVSLV